MKRFLAFLALLAAPLSAQTKSADATASITVAAELTLTKTQDLLFGTVTGVTSAQTSDIVYAAWTGTLSNSAHYSLSFVVPSVLTHTDGTSTIEFACSMTSAHLVDGASDLRFNPFTGLADAGATSGSFSVDLGRFAGSSTDQCGVALADAIRGTYSGTITLTAVVI
jgi:hypothetical protein